MSIENLIHTKEFEQKVPHEIERKFIPLFPELLDKYRAESLPIEQMYLSHHTDAFSLRLRESFSQAGEPKYEATLKDTGIVTTDGLDRFEQTCRITEELYRYYKTADIPVLRKLRAEPLPGVVIDYYEDGSIQIESEVPASWEQFVARHGNIFADVTGDRSSNNDWKAHTAFRRTNQGREALLPQHDLQPDDIIRDILVQHVRGTPVIVHIGGRSGSGKSTLVNELRHKLASSWAKLGSVVLSTDDYHRGTAWLTAYNSGEPWTKWDAPIVYDTETMAADITQLMNHHSISKHEIDWSIAEPVITGTIEPADVIIIEGIYAISPDITQPNDLQYEMATGLATCIGRRLLRDLRERPEFADPEISLRYMLSEAEPAYRAQRART